MRDSHSGKWKEPSFWQTLRNFLKRDKKCPACGRRGFISWHTHYIDEKKTELGTVRVESCVCGNLLSTSVPLKPKKQAIDEHII